MAAIRTLLIAAIHNNIMYYSVCLQGKQRVLRRDSVIRVELAELSAELDLGILSRLESLSRAFSHCPSQNCGPELIQVEPPTLHCLLM